jgi:hypothetical protein
MWGWGRPSARPGWLDWTLLQCGILLAASCLLAALGRLPELVPALAWIVAAAALTATIAVAWRPADDLAAPAQDRLPLAVTLAVLALVLAVAWSARAFASTESPVPLGYDYGFYEATFDHFATAGDPVHSQPAWMERQFEPGLPALHAVLEGVSGLSADDHLRYLVPGVGAVACLAGFLAARAAAGILAGLLAAALLAVAPLQLEGHAFLYEKNLVANALLLVAAFLLQRHAWSASGAVLGGLGVLHRPTLLVATMGFAVAVLADPVMRSLWRGWARTAAVAAGLFVPIWIAIPATFADRGAEVAVQSIAVVAGTETVGGGTFLPLSDSLGGMAPYLPLAVAAGVLALGRPALRTLALLLLCLGIYVAAELPFHRRFLLLADVLAIVLASGALVPLAGPRRAAAVAVAVAVVAASMGVAMVAEPSAPHRFVDGRQWEELAWLRTLPTDATLVADNLRAPYVLAESDRRTFGPGLFDDPHRRGDWSGFWSGLQGDDLQAFMEPYLPDAYVVQVDEPGADWGQSSLREPAFELVHDRGGLRVWHYVGGTP